MIDRRSSLLLDKSLMVITRICQPPAALRGFECNGGNNSYPSIQHAIFFISRTPDHRRMSYCGDAKNVNVSPHGKILSAIGAGEMKKVYRAKDSKLSRE